VKYHAKILHLFPNRGPKATASRQAHHLIVLVVFVVLSIPIVIWIELHGDESDCFCEVLLSLFHVLA
jgi:hypothetical protein